MKMVSVKTKLGQKGQIVIPKVFRDEYGLEPETEITLKDLGEGILLQRPLLDIAGEFARIAQRSKPRPKINLHALEEEYEERMKRSGLR